jgi:signal peptidase II
VRGAALSARRTAFITAGTVVVLDQITKWIVVRSLSDGPVVLIDGFLELRLVENPGSAFSLFRGGGAVLALIAIAAAVSIFVILRQIPNRWEGIALGLVLGGALGNLADRIFRGAGFLDGKVVDFVDFSFFPAFNVADSAITIGAVLAVLLALRER